jgi:hypothetical protein
MAAMVAVAAVFAFSALAAGMASAKEPNWFVCETGTPQDPECPTGEREKELVSPATRAFTSENEPGTFKKLKGTVAGVKIDIECATEVDEGTIIGGTPGKPGTPGKDEVTTRFTKCEVVEHPGCKVAEPIALESLSTLAWKAATGQAAVEIFKPKTGTTFVTITFGSGCGGLAGLKFEVTGEVIAEVLPVAKKEAVGTLVFPGTPILKYWTGDTALENCTGTGRTEHTIAGLKFGVEKATFTDRDLVRLVSGKKFGVFANERKCN